KGCYQSCCLVSTTRPISIKLRPTPANITGSQKPELEPPKLLGKRLTSGGISSNSKSKPSSNSQQKHEAGSYITKELSRKTVGSLNIQELKTAKQQVADQGNAKCTDPVD
ncbi:cytoskeleton-associated protein, partial [Lynx pardinus]